MVAIKVLKKVSGQKRTGIMVSPHMEHFYKCWMNDGCSSMYKYLWKVKSFHDTDIEIPESGGTRTYNEWHQAHIPYPNKEYVPLVNRIVQLPLI